MSWYTLLSLAVLILSEPLAALVHPRSAPADYYRDDSQKLTTDQYFVVLHDNYTLKTHFEYIGVDLSKTSNLFSHLGFINTYVVQVDEYTIHNVIRYDPGVKYVQHDHYLRPDPVVDEKPASTKRQWSSLRRRWRVFQLYWYYGAVILANWGKLPTPVQSGIVNVLDSAGTGVYVYVLDSGIRLSHIYFRSGGPAINFQNAATSQYCYDEPMDDSDGHGTHVAGIVKQNALGTTIVNVKILCDDGTLGRGAIAIRDVGYEHLAFRGGNGTPAGWRGTVINISQDLGTGPVVKALCEAFADEGIPIVTSAGNQGASYASSPCGYGAVECVTALDANYQKPSWANYGPQITIVAPGANIVSASYLADDAEVSKSGTSFAAPHVAGAMAIYVGWESITRDVNLVAQRLHENAQSGLLGGNAFAPNTVDLLVNHGLSHPQRDPNSPYYGAPNQPAGAQAGEPVGPDATVTTSLAAMTIVAVSGDDFEGQVPGTPRPTDANSSPASPGGLNYPPDSE